MMTRMQASSLFGDLDMFGWAETPEEEKDREIENLEASMEATRQKLREARDYEGPPSSLKYQYIVSFSASFSSGNLS